MRLARVYLDQDMRCSFTGIMSVLRKDKITPETLGKGSMIIFMNKAATKFKLLAGKDYLVYYSNGHRRIPLEAIQHLPSYFDGSSLELGKAIDKSVRERLRIE